MSTFEEEFADAIEVQYKSVIAILCKCDTAHAASAAEQILHQFESKFLSLGTDGAEDQSFLHSHPPTTETYNNIITCWVNSGRDFYHHLYSPNYRHSPHPPANILSEMISLYERNPNFFSRIRPDRITFNMVLTSLSYHQRSEQSTLSDQYLKEIKHRSFDFLQTMLQYYKQGCDDCAPDMVTFSTVLNMISRGPPEHEDGHRASQILDEMLDLSSSSYKYDVTPPAKHFNVVLGLMADQKRVDNSTLDKARRYVQVMEKLAKQNLPRSMDVEQYLESLSPQSLQPADNSSFTSSKPDRVTYNSLIKIASNAGMPEASHEILNEMIKRSTAGDESVKPDVISFNTVRFFALSLDIPVPTKPTLKSSLLFPLSGTSCMVKV